MHIVPAENSSSARPELATTLLARAANLTKNARELAVCGDEATAAGDTNVAVLVLGFVGVLQREARWLQELAMRHGGSSGSA